MLKLFLKTYGLLLALGAFFLLVIALGLTQYFESVGNKVSVVSETLVEIPHASSLRRVSSILEQEKIIDNAEEFYWYLRLGRSDSAKIQAGHYQFSGEMSQKKLAERLLLGRDLSYKLTFKEGQTIVELADALEELGLCSKEEFTIAMNDPEVKALVNAPEVMGRKALKNDVGGVEGYLFPDTYFFTKKDSAKEIIMKMHQRLQELLDPVIMQAMADGNLTLHQVLTIAAIVEKETGAGFERPIISSVYQNRLRIGMRLQADPTVIYGMKDYQGKIRKKDLQTYHPYNTYKIKGLPPGPIAAPGIEAIKAVLWPDDTNYLYFVSKNDGSHIFCENLACHNKAVQKWQIEYFKNASSK